MIDSDGSKLLRNVAASLLNYVESHFRRPKFWSFLPREFHIAHGLAVFRSLIRSAAPFSQCIG